MTAVARSPPLSFLVRLSAPTTPPPAPSGLCPCWGSWNDPRLCGSRVAAPPHLLSAVEQVPAPHGAWSPSKMQARLPAQGSLDRPPPSLPTATPGAGKGPQRGSREGNYPYCVARSATPSSIPSCLNADCDSDQLHGHLDFTTHGKGPGPQCTHRPDVASAPVPPAVRVALTQEPLWTDCQIY